MADRCRYAACPGLKADLEFHTDFLGRVAQQSHKGSWDIGRSSVRVNHERSIGNESALSDHELCRMRKGQCRITLPFDRECLIPNPKCQPRSTQIGSEGPFHGRWQVLKTNRRADRNNAVSSLRKILVSRYLQRGWMSRKDSRVSPCLELEIHQSQPSRIESV